MTGDLQVPVCVGGTIDEPRFEPDLMATVGAAFGRGRAHERSARARVERWLDQPLRAPDLSELRRNARARRAKKTPKKAEPSDVVETIEARIADASPEESDELIRQLIEAGVDLDVIDQMLERRRRRR